MNRSRQTPDQVISNLREAKTMLEGGRSPHVLQHLGVSEATFNRRRNQYGGMRSEEAGRPKEFEVQNAGLKRLVAEKELAIAIRRDGTDALRTPEPPRGRGRS